MQLSNNPADYAVNADNPLTFSVSHKLGQELVTYFMPLASLVTEDGSNALELAYKNKDLDEFT